VRRTFDRLLTVLRSMGPVTVVPQTTRIALMVDVRFAHLVVRQASVDLGLWLTRRAEHPRMRRVETLGPRTHVLTIRLERPGDVDPALRSLLRESYAIGRRQHLLGGERTPRQARSRR